ncbi:MAG: hypothetical protein LBM96_10010 [Methanobrevibacter sp.]|nr:hypothetical protein [Candidatus Methanoflexus mossambicus]
MDIETKLLKVNHDFFNRVLDFHISDNRCNFLLSSFNTDTISYAKSTFKYEVFAPKLIIGALFLFLSYLNI